MEEGEDLFADNQTREDGARSMSGEIYNDHSDDKSVN